MVVGWWGRCSLMLTALSRACPPSRLAQQAAVSPAFFDLPAMRDGTASPASLGKAGIVGSLTWPHPVPTKFTLAMWVELPSTLDRSVGTGDFVTLLQLGDVAAEGKYSSLGGGIALQLVHPASPWPAQPGGAKQHAKAPSFDGEATFDASEDVDSLDLGLYDDRLEFGLRVVTSVRKSATSRVSLATSAVGRLIIPAGGGWHLITLTQVRCPLPLIPWGRPNNTCQSMPS